MRVSEWVAPSMAVASASYTQLSTAPLTIPSSSILQSQPSTMVLTTSSVVSSPSTLLSSDWSSPTEATSSRSSQPTTLMTSISNNATDTVMSIVTKPVTTKTVDVWITTNSSTSVDPSTVTLLSTVTVSPSSTTTIEPTQVPTGDCKITYLDPGFSGAEASYPFMIKGIDWSSEGIHDAAMKCGNVLDFTIDKSPLTPFQWTASGTSVSDLYVNESGLECLKKHFDQAGAEANLSCSLQREVPEHAASCDTEYDVLFDRFFLQGAGWSYAEVEDAVSQCGALTGFQIMDHCSLEGGFGNYEKCNYGWRWQAAGNLPIEAHGQARCIERKLKKHAGMPLDAHCVYNQDRYNGVIYQGDEPHD